MRIKKDELVDAIGNIEDKYIEEAKTKKKRYVFSWALTGKVLTGVLCLLLVVTIIPSLFRMGSAKSAEPMEAYKTEDAMEAPLYNNGLGGVGASSEETKNENLNTLKENRKLIVTGNINIETLEFDTLLENLKRNIEEAGGYIQNSSISTNYNESRIYDATIRIPADKYSDFISKTKETGNVTWYNESVDDITETYTDLEARLNSLKAEETKVLEFYAKAENIEELMSIENRLTDIRYEIDSIQTRLKNYDLVIEYSTLNISVFETKVYTKTNDNFFSRLSLSFRNGFTNFINSIENFIIDLAYSIWTIIVIAMLTVVAVVVIKKIRKNRK